MSNSINRSQQQDLADKQGIRDLHISGYTVCYHVKSDKYIMPGSTKENPILVDKREAVNRYMGLQ
jgi:hypothetical protein